MSPNGKIINYVYTLKQVFKKYLIIALYSYENGFLYEAMLTSLPERHETIGNTNIMHTCAIPSLTSYVINCF